MKLETVWYHGGMAHLEVGNVILPLDAYPSYFFCPGDPSHVYVSPNRRKAEEFAALWSIGTRRGQGWVYRVKPVGPIEADLTDFGPPSKIRYFCRSAEVLEVLT